MKELLELPIYLQIVIASGYVGYTIAQRDYRKNEKTTDMWLAILLFGLPSGVILTLTDSHWSYLSVLIAPFLGWVWAKKGKSYLSKLLHWSRASYENNEGDIWNTLATRKGVEITQITVTLTNGRQYHCSDTAIYNKEEFAPCLFDDDGIAFYVDHYKTAEGKWETEPQVKDKSMGAAITYFPKSDIALLEVRFK